MIPRAPEDRDVLAGEYVLGLLEADALAEVEAALALDSDLAGRVAFWEAQFLPAVAGLEPAPVDPARWARIEAALGPRRPGRAAPAWRQILGRAWASPGPWRAATALATAAAIWLGLPANRPWAPPESPTRYFAILQSRDEAGGEGGPGWIIQVLQDGTIRSLPLADVRPGQGRALQLWTLWDAARGPVSLGVLPAGGAVRLPPERLESIGGDQLFEITLEPEAGSPTGRPTGRILFIGRAKGAPTRAL